MVEIPSKKDIDKTSYELLKQSKALGILPTPIDKIIACSELIVAKNIDLSKAEDSFFERATIGIEKLWRNVRGFLDRWEKTIYIDLSQLPSRQNFVKLHETGHHVLPWQNATYQFLDDDQTLDPDIVEEFEAEANYFASATLFQHERFGEEMAKLPLDIDASRTLSKMFGASFHATIRRYIDHCKQRSALLILERISGRGETPICYLRNYFESPTFLMTFGNIEWPEKFGYNWDFVKPYYFQRKGKVAGQIKLNTAQGEHLFQYHFFNNGYNAFVLLFPFGEKNNSKVTIINTEISKPFVNKSV